MPQISEADHSALNPLKKQIKGVIIFLLLTSQINQTLISTSVLSSVTYTGKEGKSGLDPT